MLGYISIQSFGSSTAFDTRVALTALETRGVAGYVIDLRNNGGGLVSAGMLGPLLLILLVPLGDSAYPGKLCAWPHVCTPYDLSTHVPFGVIARGLRGSICTLTIDVSHWCVLLLRCMSARQLTTKTRAGLKGHGAKHQMLTQGLPCRHGHRIPAAAREQRVLLRGQPRGRWRGAGDAGGCARHHVGAHGAKVKDMHGSSKGACSATHPLS